MIYSVNVKTGSKKGPLVVCDEDNNLVVYLREKPHDGEANGALVKVLADYFGVAKSLIKILRDGKSHSKLIEVVGK